MMAAHRDSDRDSDRDRNGKYVIYVGERMQIYNKSQTGH